MKRTSFRYFILISLSFIFISWGSKGHYAINNKCPESFPTTMNAFKVWADSLDLHASDADNRKSSDPNESPKHYIDLENYSEFISKGRIASTYDSIITIHGSSFVVSNGTLPWATRSIYDTLKVAFKQLNWHKAMLCASDLGHYVADGFMPLHLSANYDGQKTNQKGIHSRYESDLVYYYLSNLTNYSGFQLNYISNVNKYIFNYIYTNQHYVDSLLNADNYAVKIDATYSTPYYSALWSKTQFTTSLFKNASHSLAELIYSAWLDAGSPPFGSKTQPNEIITPANLNILLFPNPSNGNFQIIGENNFKIVIFDLMGKMEGIYFGKSYNISHLANGIYFAHIYSNNIFQKSEKIIIEK